VRTLFRRVKNLEEAKRMKKVVIVWKNPGESANEVIERHLEANPEHRGQGFDLFTISWQDPDANGAG